MNFGQPPADVLVRAIFRSPPRPTPSRAALGAVQEIEQEDNRQRKAEGLSEIEWTPEYRDHIARMIDANFELFGWRR